MKHFMLLIGVILFPFFSIFGVQPDFFCNFNSMDAEVPGGTLPPQYFTTNHRHQTVTGGGISSRSALFARENLEAFQTLVPGLDEPLPAIVYTPLKSFPLEKGYFDIWAAPYFNQISPYRDNVRKNYTSNAIARIYRHKEGERLIASEGKSEIRLFFYNRILVADLVFENGAKATLSCQMTDWKPTEFRRITLTWEPGDQRLYVNRKLMAQKDVKGTFSNLNALELGGRDLNLSFQGLIDDVTLGAGFPAWLNVHFDGDRKVFKVIAPSQPWLQSGNWSSSQNISVSANASGIGFQWDGSSLNSPSVWSKHPLPVKSDSYLKGELEWLKKQWNFGSRVTFFIRFEDDRGIPLQILRFDTSNIPGYVAMLHEESGTVTAGNIPLSYFNYWKVPPKAVALRFGVSCSGNPSVFELRKLQFSYVDPLLSPWFSQPLRGPQIDHRANPLSEEHIRDLLQKRVRPIPVMKREGDRMELYVNGKKAFPAIFMNSMIGSYERDASFDRAGYRIFTSSVILGENPFPDDYRQTWREDGTLDVEALKEAVYRVLRYAPDAYVMLQIVVSPPRNWLLANQGELVKNEKGENAVFRNCALSGQYSREIPKQKGMTWFPSLSSEKYKADVSRILTDLFTQFERTPASNAVIGVYLTGGDDGQFRSPKEPDLSPLSRQDFQNFLRKRYSTEENLRKAWNDPKATFETAEIPSLQKLSSCKNLFYSTYGESVESDYNRFVSQKSFELKSTMRKAVKTGAPRLLAGGYDVAISLTGTFGQGRHSQKALLEDPWTDFMISLPGYSRNRDECIFPLGMKNYNGSMVLHKKWIVSEMDIRNPEQPPLNYLYNQTRNWQAYHNHETFRNFINLYVGYAMAWGGTFHTLPLGRFWYDTEKAVQAWKEAVRIAGQTQGAPYSKDRIAVFVDDETHYYFTFTPGLVFQPFLFKDVPIKALWQSGLRTDYYLAEDILHPDFEAPKVFFFLDASCMKKELAEQIRKKYGNSNRIFVWLGAPGFLGKSSLQDVQSICGFTVAPVPGIQNRPLFVKSSSNPFLKDVKGFPFEIGAGHSLSFSENWSIQDPASQSLATYFGTDISGMAVKKYPSHTEIFIGQSGAITPQLMRNIAKEAGIRPILESGDLLVTGGSLIAIGASTGNSVRRVQYPEGVKSVKCLTGQKITKTGPDFCDIELKYGESAVLRLFY